MPYDLFTQVSPAYLVLPNKHLQEQHNREQTAATDALNKERSARREVTTAKAQMIILEAQSQVIRDDS